MRGDARQLVDKAIREILAPLLRADGFKGSGRRYCRVHGELIHILNVQGSQYSRALAVNLGIHLRFLGAMGGRPVDPVRLHDSECFLRRRMTDGRSGGDQWWEHDGTADSIASAVMTISRVYTQLGRGMFDQFSNYPGSFAHFTPDNVLGGTHGFGINVWTAEFARIRMHEGDTAAALAFIQRGLKDARAGDPKRALLEDLRSKALQQSSG